MLNPNQYAKDVLSGKIIAPQLVINAIKRNERDLKRNDIYFDPEAGAKALQFITCLTHTKGKWAGKKFIPLPWQQWLIYTLYGWKRPNGNRRFRTAYIEVPRKNGKSTKVSGIGNYMFYGDEEEGPQVYTGATTTKQSKIVFNECRAQAMLNPHLKKITNIYQHSMVLKNSPVSVFEPVSREANNLDGLNPNCAIIDEYHAHKTSAIYDVFKSAMGSREEPMLLVITTAGFNKGAPCYQLRRACIDILTGVKDDDSLFTMIYTPDDGDDWTDPEVWKKVNPSYGETVNIDYLHDQFIQAKNNVGEQVNFKTKHLNMWSDSSTTWIDSNVWKHAKMEITEAELQEMECYGGLDLASTRDITAYVLVFTDGERCFIKPTFFIPEETASYRSKADGVAYSQWAKEGIIKTTSGNVTDYNFIHKHIVESTEQYKIKRIAYDRWNSSQLIIDLMNDGANMVPFGQGFKSMSVPTKEIERKVVNGELKHDGNLCLEWMISNVEVSIDPSGNIKADKKKSSEKIDGVVAMAMGIGEWVADGMTENPQDSVYEQRGLISF